MKNLFFYLILLFTIPAFAKGIDKWIGQTEETLITKAGAPTSVYTAGETKVLTYRVEQGTVALFGGNVMHRVVCTGTFVVKKGIIVDAKEQGACGQ